MFNYENAAWVQESEGVVLAALTPISGFDTIAFLWENREPTVVVVAREDNAEAQRNIRISRAVTKSLTKRPYEMAYTCPISLDDVRKDNFSKYRILFCAFSFLHADNPEELFLGVAFDGNKEEKRAKYDALYSEILASAGLSEKSRKPKPTPESYRK